MSVDAYLRASIAPSTAATYATAVRHFREHRASKGWLPDAPITTDHAMDWLAELADRGQHTAATIAVYRSALRTQALLETRPDNAEPNPLDHPLVAAVYSGIARTKAPRDAERRDARRASEFILTFDLVIRMQAAHNLSIDRECMLFAAIALAGASAVRPGEAFAGHNKPERWLRTNQITFFSDDRALSAIADPLKAAASTRPAACELKLLVSKTDQLWKGKTLHVAQPTAVAALWRWIRQGHRAGSALLFPSTQDPSVPITLSAVLGHLQRRLGAIGILAKPTGKCFRKGAASTLAAGGIAAADIAGLGWAPHSQAYANYTAHPATIRQRRHAVAAQMESIARATGRTASDAAAAARPAVAHAAPPSR